MKKFCIFLVLILVVLNCSCGSTIDLDSILEIDNGSLSQEGITLNHKNAISESPVKQKNEDVQTNIKIKINEEEMSLVYDTTCFYPVGEKRVHLYLINGDEEKKVLIDESGNVNSLLYKFAHLDISPFDSPEAVWELLQPELCKYVDLKNYAHMKMPNDSQNEYGFSIYDYYFYNETNGYMTDYVIVSVSQKGNVLGLKINDLPTHDFKVDIDSEKEKNAIELKVKDMFNTNKTEYISHEMHFEPRITVYNGQVYVKYYVSAQFKNTVKNAEMSSFLISILIPLDMINK